MDLVKIGKFIADCRKNKKLTQAELAEKLNITDRAISKWETGKGLPDSSIMIDLCNELGITVNELLSGEMIEMNNYNLKAEQNLLEMKKQKEKSDKEMTKIKIISLLIVAIFIVFIILTVRKMLIISDLSEKADATININNYHKIVNYYNDDVYKNAEIFKLDDKIKMIQKIINSDGVSISTIYAKEIDTDEFGNKNYVGNIYEIKDDSKTLIKNTKIGISVDPQNNIRTENLVHLLISSIMASVKSTTYNGIECYHIKNFNALNSFTEGMYIEKESGLLISQDRYEITYTNTNKIDRSTLSEAKYEFNTVTEEDFIEPNQSEYKEIENVIN